MSMAAIHANMIDIRDGMLLSSSSSPLPTSKSITKTFNETPPLPSPCTPKQVDAILQQLSPRPDCYAAPWAQKCSITQATKCPDSSLWLEDYYKRKFASRLLNNNNEQLEAEADDHHFVAVNVGCNKGYDALHYLQMGTFVAAADNNIPSKQAWKEALGADIAKGVCGQEASPDFVHDTIFTTTASQPRRLVASQVHCIEPMPATVQALRRAANTTGINNHQEQSASPRFHIVQAAMSNSNGTAWFPSGLKAGTENARGIVSSSPKSNQQQRQLEGVPQMTLDDYVSHYSVSLPIDVLLIDVEGHDFNVLLGANQTLEAQGVQYLEFEYNWHGPWGKQQLVDVIHFLSSKNFICYWAGVGKLWRLDDSCWLEHYNAHFWSNVACVNPRLVPDLALRMEEIFQATIESAGADATP